MRRLSVIIYQLLVYTLIAGCYIHGYGFAETLNPQPSVYGYEVPDEEIKAAVVEYLEKTLPIKKDDMTIEDIDIKTKVVLPKKNGAPPVVMLPKGYKTPGKINMAVNFQDKDWTKTVWVSARVLRLRDVVVATRVLPMNHIIDNSDIRLEKMDVGDIADNIFSGVNMLLGMKVKRPITANAVIKGDYVYKPNLIKKGETVDVVVESGAIVITLIRCEAREDGSLGKVIKVGNPSSGKEIRGVVVGSGKVLVRL